MFLSSSSSSSSRLFPRRTMIASATTIASSSRVGAVRFLNVHEYISMELFSQNNIATPKCYVANSAEEAENIYLHKLNKTGKPLKDVVIKAQVISVGRGVGTFKNGFKGGIHMITKPGQAREFADKMLGQHLVTKQAPFGIICNKVLLVERVHMEREMYLSIMMDRNSQGPVMIGAPYGGASLKDVVQSNPDLIFTEPIDIMEGLLESQCDRMAKNMSLEPGTEPYTKTKILMKNLYEMFIGCDCTQVELNPLAETPDGDVVVCDAKVNFDPNAAYRQASVFDKRDYTQEDQREVDAAQNQLNYIGLDGNIGCMVNGAGLALATNDLIQSMGGSSANFLQVAGASKSQVQKGFEILNDDPNVKAILINIFGGILRCDVIAGGIILAAEEIGIRKPVVIRLQGTNVEEANKLIEGCGFKMIMAADFEDAVQKVVDCADTAAQAENSQAGVQFDGFQI